METDFCIALLHFLRMVPGELYPDQVTSFIEKNNALQEGKEILENYRMSGNLETVLNQFFQKKFPGLRSCIFVKENRNTGAVYTVPGIRKEYDCMIKEYYPDYSFNPFLYNTQEFFESENRNCIRVEKIPVEKVVIIKKEGIEIDFTKLSNKRHISIYQFSLTRFLKMAEEYIKLKTGADFERIVIRRICIDQICFCGVTYFSVDTSDVLEMCSGLEEFSAENTSFGAEVYVQNILFYFKRGSNDIYMKKGISFRNARFFGAVYIRNIKFRGNTDTATVSFEDARFEQRMEMNNVLFGNVKLIFFQTILGSRKNEEEGKSNLFLKNLCFSEKSEIDFTGVETLTARVELVNIDYLPIVKARFESVSKKGSSLCSADVFLLFKNCKIYNPIYIKNISKLSFWKTRNFSQIVEEEDWEPVFGGEKAVEVDKILKKQKIKSKLVIAVYNNNENDYFDTKDNLENILAFAKAKDFVMLKENFRAAGEYDREDQAFLLYMKYKPYLDAWNRYGSINKIRKKRINGAVYMILDVIGKYGISPGRIFIVWLFAIIIRNVKGNVVMDAIMSTLDAFLIGYFSVAVVRKTLH